MSKSPVKVLLIEDDELFRLGLRMRLQQEGEIEIVAEAEDGETAVELVRNHQLDLVLLDVGLPGLGGIEACRQIKREKPNLPVLVLTSHSESPLIVRLIEVGTQGYCLKGVSAETLILAIRSVVAGASWWDLTATTEIRAAFEFNSASMPISDKNRGSINVLTRREQEILALIAAEKTNQEIAELLYITPGTVKAHVHTILQKLEVRDRSQAVVIAIQKNLIATDLLSG